MSNLLKISIVAELPPTYEPSTMYVVMDSHSEYMQIHLSDKLGTSLRRVLTPLDVASMTPTVDPLPFQSTSRVVATIVDRDALVLTDNAGVLVLDATGDTTVTNGAAYYFYELATTTWHKVSEAESLDVVLSWDKLVNGPSSIPALIDAAVGAAHMHANTEVIDSFNDVEGVLYYGNKPLRGHLDEVAW